MENEELHTTILKLERELGKSEAEVRRLEDARAYLLEKIIEARRSKNGKIGYKI